VLAKRLIQPKIERRADVVCPLSLLLSEAKMLANSRTTELVIGQESPIRTTENKAKQEPQQPSQDMLDSCECGSPECVAFNFYNVTENHLQSPIYSRSLYLYLHLYMYLLLLLLLLQSSFCIRVVVLLLSADVA